jgi:hypothetical protein
MSSDGAVGATSTDISIFCDGDLGLRSSLEWKRINYGNLMVATAGVVTAKVEFLRLIIKVVDLAN